MCGSAVAEIMFHVEKIVFHAADGFLWQGFDRVNAWDFALYNPQKTEFTAEQQALAQDFMSMAEEFDAIADKVNASPELLENEELVTAMNDLSSEIIKAEEYFASPETLTPEIMGALTVAIDVGRTFIAEAGATLEEIGH